MTWPWRLACLRPASAGSGRRASTTLMLLIALAALTAAKVASLVDHASAPAAPAPGERTATPEAAGKTPSPTTATRWPGLPEPAAGPDHGQAAAGVETPPPDIGDGAATTSPPEATRHGSRRFTASEVDVLLQLAARRSELDERARRLDERAALVEVAETQLARQIERLSELHAEIQAMVDQHDMGEDAKLASLVKIYETMKPKAAAEIFNRLEMAILIEVVERMREAKSADVLARMDPVKAKQVTAALARRRPLPTAAEDRAAENGNGRPGR